MNIFHTIFYYHHSCLDLSFSFYHLSSIHLTARPFIFIYIIWIFMELFQNLINIFYYFHLMLYFVIFANLYFIFLIQLQIIYHKYYYLSFHYFMNDYVLSFDFLGEYWNISLLIRVEFRLKPYQDFHILSLTLAHFLIFFWLNFSFLIIQSYLHYLISFSLFY